MVVSDKGTSIGGVGVNKDANRSIHKDGGIQTNDAGSCLLIIYNHYACPVIQKRIRKIKITEFLGGEVKSNEMKRNEDKLFIVRSYIKAKNASDALRKFRKQEPDDVYVSDDWKEGKNKELSTAIGFDNGMTDEDDV